MTLHQLSYVLLWSLAIVLIPISAVLLYLLAHLKEQVVRESSGLGNNLIGRSFPMVSAKDLSTGRGRDIRIFPNQVHVVLALSPGCNTCVSLMGEFEQLGNSEFTKINVLVLCMGDIERCRAVTSRIHAVPVFFEDRRDDSTINIWYAGFPAAIIVDEAGFVVDVRHPFTIKGMVAAVNNPVVSERSLARERRVASA